MENNKENIASQYAHIKGWGVDADPTNEPTHPMKKYTGDDHKRLNWERPEQQPVDVEILHSNERPSVSAVFGNTFPPSGLSGAVRRMAFKYSEGKIEHWLALLLADRINVVEGVIDDIVHGHVPNFYGEKGWKSDFKYNKKGFAQKVFLRVAIVSAIGMYLYRKNKVSKA